MSPSLLPIMTIMGVLLILGLVISLIPWRRIGESVFSNNSTKALVYIEMGKGQDCETDCVAGKYFYSNEKGAMYNYVWRKCDLTVALRANYGYRWLHGRRCIRIANPGDAWASDWPKSEVPADIQKSGFDLNALVKGHVGERLVKTIYGSSKLNWTVVLLIIGAAILGYYFYTNYFAGGDIADTANPPAIEQPAQPTKPLG